MEITKDQFMAYEEVRISGVTNMFDVKRVMKLSKLTKPVVMEVMKQYSELSAKYLKGDIT